MGGYGALYLGFHRPDIFSATYALSPSCLEFIGDLTLDSPEWRTVAMFRGFDVFQQEDHYLAQAFAASPEANVNISVGLTLQLILTGDSFTATQPILKSRISAHGHPTRKAPGVFVPYRVD